MAKIKIVTDSTVDIDQNIIDELHITVVPLSITIDGESYIDGVDLQPDEFIEKMEKAKALPKSSQPSVGKFKEVYDHLGQDGNDVISIHMTGGMSGTVMSAGSAAQMTNTNVTIIDSFFISKALSFQVIEAAKMAKEGRTTEEIVNRLAEIKKNTSLFVSVDTLENLVKGGRIGRGRALVGSLLNIKPIASLKDGVYTPVTKVRSRSQVIKFLVDQLIEDTKGKTIRAIGIAHADSYDLALRLQKQIVSIYPQCQIDISFTTPIISTHTGRGALGFMYYAE